MAALSQVVDGNKSDSEAVDSSGVCMQQAGDDSFRFFLGMIFLAGVVFGVLIGGLSCVLCRSKRTVEPEEEPTPAAATGDAAGAADAALGGGAAQEELLAEIRRLTLELCQAATLRATEDVPMDVDSEGVPPTPELPAATWTSEHGERYHIRGNCRVLRVARGVRRFTPCGFCAAPTRG